MVTFICLLELQICALEADTTQRPLPFEKFGCYYSIYQNS